MLHILDRPESNERVTGRCAHDCSAQQGDTQCPHQRLLLFLSLSRLRYGRCQRNVFLLLLESFLDTDIPHSSPPPSSTATYRFGLPILFNLGHTSDTDPFEFVLPTNTTFRSFDPNAGLGQAGVSSSHRATCHVRLQQAESDRQRSLHP